MSEPIQAIATNNYLLTTTVGSGYMETSELEYDGDKISGYAGSAFKAGDTYSAGDNISIANNEISVTGTEDLTLMPIVAGNGINIVVSGGAIVISLA